MRRVTFCLVVITIAALCGASASHGAKGEKLFRFASAPGSVKIADQSSIASKREAEIVFDRGVTTAVTDLLNLDIPLFDGKSYAASRTGTEIRSPEDITWRGKISADGIDGDIILTFRKGFVVGLIYSPQAVFEIVPRGNKHFLVELDQSKFPECAGDVKGAFAPVIDAPSATTDSGDRIDVLVVYTPATKLILGGDAQSAAHAQAAIDATNTAYINSHIRQRVRLVHTAEYNYVETASASTDLSNLRSNADIQSLRNTHIADLVAMIGEIQGACGIGYLMGAAGGNQNNAFTATARSCAVGNLSFAHELGHNMGSQHNPENGSNPTYPYGFGHYVNGSYRTVMSYSDPCTSGCTRRPYFSNPNILFNGVPTGIPNSRDNARSINNTADTIANYRYSGSNLLLGTLNSGEVIRRVAGTSINWTSDNMKGQIKIELSRDEGQSWETVVADTADDGVETVRITGRPTTRARLRLVSLTSPAISDSSVKNFTIQ